MQSFIRKFQSKNFIINKENLKKIYYEDLFAIIKKQIKYFKRNSFKKNEIVASFLPNSIENIVLFISCGLCGLKFFPIDCNTPEKKLNELISSLKIKKLFIDRRNKLYSKKKYIPISCNCEFDWLKKIKPNKVNFSLDGKLILFTSGTTGNNKLIQLDFRKLVLSAENFVNFYKIKNETILNIFQTSYLGGLFNSFLIPVISSSNIIFFNFFSSIDILNFWKHLKNFNITSVWFTPSLIRSLLDLIENKSINKIKSNLKYSFCGTAYLNKKIKKKFNKTFNTNILENYGLSETTFISLENKNSEKTYKKGFVGSLLDSIKVKFNNIDKKNNKEILVNTKYIFDGYLDLNGKWINKKIDDYFSTGDLGNMEKNKNRNYLFINGRKNEIIKKRGNLVNLNLIEELFQKNNLVNEVKAVSIHDKDSLEDYKLFIKLKKKLNKNISLKKIYDWSYANLNRNLFPKEIIIKNKFPKTRSGKVKIFQL